MSFQDAKFALIAAAAARRPHGTRARYVTGCKCLICRAANARYHSEREQANRRCDTNPMVSADAARAHLQWLSRNGVGRRSVHNATDLNETTLRLIIRGERAHVRRQTEQRILAVDLQTRGDNTLVRAGKAWRLIDELLSDGYTKKQIAAWLGYKAPALQLRRDWITARNEMRIERMYRLVRAGRLSR